MSLQQKIDKLLPYVSENFITYPLIEEGKYIPFINFWFICKDDTEFNKLGDKIGDSSITGGYIVDIVSENIFIGSPFNIQIYPDFEDTEEGGYEFADENWSIEQMLEIITELIEK